MAKLIGTAPNQVPTNGDLGKLAFKDVVVVPPPASASSEGSKGEIAIDDDYIYICIDTDTWKRVGISTW